MRKLTLSALSAACVAVAGVAIAQGTMSPQPGSAASATAPTIDRSAPTSATGGTTSTTPGNATTVTPGTGSTMSTPPGSTPGATPSSTPSSTTAPGSSSTTVTPGSSGSSSMDANRNADGTMRAPRQDRN